MVPDTSLSNSLEIFSIFALVKESQKGFDFMWNKSHEIKILR